MEPCIVCQSDPEISTVESVIVIDGVALCQKHRDSLEASGLEYKQVDRCSCPLWVKASRAKGNTEPHQTSCPGFFGKPTFDNGLDVPKAYSGDALDQTVDVKEMVNHPSHYGGGDNPYEVIKVLSAWGLDKDAHLWNAVKYIARAGKKDPDKEVEDLEKAQFYLAHAIKLRKEKKGQKKHPRGR